MNVVRPESVGLSTERLKRINACFQRYIDQGKLAGVITVVSRDGQVAHLECQGMADIAAQRPMHVDDIFRIYSMSKAITTTALMMLMEEGRFRLNDPVSAYIPEFKEMQVIASVSDEQAALEPAKSQITIKHLLTHTAGLSYGFDEQDYLDQLYVKHVWRLPETKPGADTGDFIRAVSKLPLRFHPGTRYQYSFAIDVLGYLIEVLSGMRFDAFLKARVFEPLGMVDTDFWVQPEKAGRLARVYGPDEKTGQLKDLEPGDTSRYFKPASFLSGGGGLVSTISDYLRFTQMILQGGELDGVRLLGRKTVELMTKNHLPDGIFIDPDKAFGFGLGGYVLLDVAKSGGLGSQGMWGWGGAASTKAWVDFEENLTGVLMVQYMPDGTYPLERDFWNMVYQAIED